MGLEAIDGSIGIFSLDLSWSFKGDAGSWPILEFNKGID